MSSVTARAKGKQRQDDSHGVSTDDVLRLLDDRTDAEPLDEKEQDAVISQLKRSNETSNRIFRGALLAILVLVVVVYAEPIPEYVMVTHPENHLTLFFGSHGPDGASHDDLTKLPAAPIYLILFAFNGSLLYLAAREIAEQMGLFSPGAASAVAEARLAPPSAAAAPPSPLPPSVRADASRRHLFGTCPQWLVPILSDLRYHPSHTNPNYGRSDREGGSPPNFVHRMPHRQLYLLFLVVVASPLPLLTFGAGAFVNSAWWAMTTAALALVWACNAWMVESERQAGGLEGYRYSYKGA